MLSLIPAKYYYDDATQDQWQQTKSTKEEIKSNKRQKLNPESDFDNNMSAKDVMEKKAKTAQPVKLPKKIVPIVEDDEDDEDVEIPDMDVDDGEEEEEEEETKEETKEENVRKDDTIEIEFDDEGNEISTREQAKQQAKKKKELSEEEKQKKQENLKKLREKLASKISNLRDKRKAPGSKANGAPKSREQILEERKKKAELKKQEKLKRKHEEIEGSDQSDNESDEEEEQQEVDSNGNVIFGNISFLDGSRVTSDLCKMRSTAEKNKAKGPANKDVKAHLLKLEKKKAKLATLSPEERAKELEKETWQRVMNQAEGVKVKDDEKLLKKALKRKEKKKLKSELEWNERKRVVTDTIAAKTKKREENLKLRRENKGKKSKNQVRLKKFTGIVNGKKKRAGFEGSAKSKKK